MASLVRVRCTYYVGPDGRRCPKDTSGARKICSIASKWYCQGVPGYPPTKRFPLSPKRRVAKQMMEVLVASAEQRRQDLPEPGAIRKPLLIHLDKFAEHMGVGLACKTRGRAKVPSQRQIGQCVQRIGKILKGCRFVNAMSLNAEAPAVLARWLRDRRLLPRKGGGFSAQTADFYRKDAKRFVWWLATRLHIPVRADLFDDIPGFDAKGNRVHLRRPCTSQELAHLLVTTRESQAVYRGLTGRDRYHVYLLAFATGFRVSELAVLSRSSFALDADQPAVALKATETKNKRPTRQPLPLAVVELFREYLAERPADGPIWPWTWAEKAVKMLRKDLAAASIEYRVETEEGPRFLDFHALRHTFITSLASANVGLKELQILARHSSPILTLDVYTHSTRAKMSEAVQKLPIPGDSDVPGILDTMTRAELQTALACSLAVNAVVMGRAVNLSEVGTSQA